MAQETKLRSRVEELEAALQEANETLAAIRKGEVDAFVVASPEGVDQVFTLRGADHPYRMLVQDMREGAVTLTPEGIILYANGRFAEMAGRPLERVIGSSLLDYVASPDRDRLRAMIAQGSRGDSTGEISLSARDSSVPVYLSFNSLQIDIKTDRLMASREGFALFGLAAADAISAERFLELVHPSDRERVLNELTAALKGPDMYESEYRTVWPDGSIHWIAARGRVELDSAGEPVRMQGTVLNIDDRKRMEEELRRASDTVNAVIAGSPVAIWLVDSSGKIAIWNAAAESLFGYGVDDVISRPGLFHLKSPSGDEILMRLAEGEVIVGLEAVCEKKGGGRIDVSFSTSSLHNEDGTSRGFVALAVDVTEQKRLDEQMRQSQKLESIGLLAGGIAHDFNNLLTGIIGNASLLAADPTSTDWRMRLDEIVKTGERAASLTKQLLAYAGKGQFYLQPVNLTAIVRALLPLIKTSLPTKSEMTLDLDDTLPAIHSDRSQIEQVLMNLVINAGEALGDSPGRITVRTYRQEFGDASAERFGMEPGQYCCLEVVDTGCGMDEVTKARVFEPFFSTKFTGRGLGLAAVHGIVRSCKGVIKVESQQGRGARFTVFFPTVMGAVIGDAGEARSALPRLSGVVLVVDDEDMVRSVAKGALEKSGLGVVLASNGLEAVEKFREAAEQIDVVLLDIKMPVMDGYETLKQLKLVRPDVKVLVSSGFSEAEAVRNFRGKGIAGFVQKPYRAAALVEAVQSAIKGKHARPRSHATSLPAAD